MGKVIRVKVTFTDNADNDESLTSEATAAVTARPNTPATGAPTISGTAQAGQALTADTSGITDEDGLTNVAFNYQWVSNDGNTDADIDGATASTYELSDDEVGNTIKVRVNFTDDRDNQESLTSEATAAVTARPNTPATGLPTISGTVQVDETLTADVSGITDEDGLTNVSFSYQWIRSDGNDDTDIAGETDSTYAVSDDDVGNTIRVRVSFSDDRDNEEALTSTATAVVEARPNSPATGLPTISGTVQAGETLTADTSGISDEDGLTNVTFSYQWLADGTDIQDATASTYEVSDDDVGKAISVRVTFTDNADNEESLTSASTAEVEARPNTQATGSADHQRYGPSGSNPHRRHVGHFRRGRADQRHLHLPVAGRRRRHSRGDGFHLCGVRRRRGQGDQGESELHRRPEQPGESNQHGDRYRKC